MYISVQNIYQNKFLMQNSYTACSNALKALGSEDLVTSFPFDLGIFIHASFIQIYSVNSVGL